MKHLILCGALSAVLLLSACSGAGRSATAGNATYGDAYFSTWGNATYGDANFSTWGNATYGDAYFTTWGNATSGNATSGNAYFATWGNATQGNASIAANGNAAPQPTETPLSPAPLSTVEARLSAMTSILDSIVRTSGIDGETPYAPKDPSYFWTALYLMSVNFGTEHPLVTSDGGLAVIPRKVMQEFASAMFADYSDLLPLPSPAPGGIVYDAGLDAYRMELSDRGESDVRIDYYSVNADGTLSVTAELYALDESFGQFEFTLIANPYASGITDARYLYTVQSANPAGSKSDAWRQIDLLYPATADLDGDGKEETISCIVRADDTFSLTVQRNGKNLTHDFGYQTYTSMYLAPQSDGRTLLLVTGDSGSDDYTTTVFQIKSGKLDSVAINGRVEGLDAEGRLLVESPVDALGTWGAVSSYKMTGSFRFERDTDYALRQYMGAWHDMALDTKKNGLPVTLIDAASGNKSETLPAGTRMLPLRTDLKSYVECELDDGRMVRVSITSIPDRWGWSIEGVNETDWFAFLPYSG